MRAKPAILAAKQRTIKNAAEGGRKIFEKSGMSMEQRQNELSVIMKAKDMSAYVLGVTRKSPKQFRFTFVSRMQNLCLDVRMNGD